MNSHPIPAIKIKIKFGKHNQSLQMKQNSLQGSFRLTQKIPALSGIKAYERNLSPWTKKRDEPIDKKSQLHSDNTLKVQANHGMSSEAIKQNSSNISNKSKMNNFLRKIQFTNKNKKYNQKKNLFQKYFKTLDAQSYEKSQQNRSNSHGMFQLTEEQTQQFIIYPRNLKRPKNLLRQNDQYHQKIVNNQLSQKKNNSSTHFFCNSLQNTPKLNLFSIPASKGLVKFCSQNYRKSSLEQKSQVFRFGLQRDTQFNQNQTSDRIYQDIKRNKFFKTKISSFPNRYATQSSQRCSFAILNPQNRIQTIEQSQIVNQPTYTTPTTQAIKIIKQQYKKRQRIKNQSRYDKVKSIHDYKDQDRQYLYQTFVNYKSQKTTNDSNITKTLKMHFYNKKTFKENLEKIWLKDPCKISRDYKIQKTETRLLKQSRSIQ